MIKKEPRNCGSRPRCAPGTAATHGSAIRHETLYAVRELRAKRVWFAEALLSSTDAEVQRLLARADEIAKLLGIPIRLWMSDKQDAFVKGIAARFPNTPHLYCDNHFLRGLARPTLEADSAAKVRMRTKVRGLRDIERAVLKGRQQDAARTPPTQPDAEVVAAEPEVVQSVTAEGGRSGGESEAGQEDAGPRPCAVAEACRDAPTEATSNGADNPATVVAASPSEAVAEQATGGVATAAERASGVVLDYCTAVRGILNDDQGGPVDPPGLRMAEALTEVRESLQRCLDLNKPGPAHGQLERLAGCIDAGLEEVKAEQQEVKEQVKEIQRVAQTLEAESGTVEERQEKYEQLREEYSGKGGEFYGRLATVMLAWAAGLFRKIEGQSVPQDNLDLERWFRNPKGHERRIHGHKHAGVRIVQEGPTLLLALDAHREHDRPFSPEDLLPYRHAQPPKDQLEAINRRKVMRKARSKKNEEPYSEI